jgi:hypothetical protein
VTDIKRKPPNAGKGRGKGNLNKTTKAIREVSTKLLTDTVYQQNLKRRLIDGVAPHMETLLHHYAYGKPKDTVAVEGNIPPFILKLDDDDADE